MVRYMNLVGTIDSFPGGVSDGRTFLDIRTWQEGLTVFPEVCLIDEHS
jgi:hypothetical protein